MENLNYAEISITDHPIVIEKTTKFLPPSCKGIGFHLEFEAFNSETGDYFHSMKIEGYLPIATTGRVAYMEELEQMFVKKTLQIFKEQNNE